MSDLYQSPGITTIPLLRPEAVVQQAADLLARRDEYPVSLILPCHARELGTPALERIVQELSANAPWLDRIVIGLDGAGEDDFRTAREIFTRLPHRTDLLWNDGPALKEVYGLLTKEGHPAETSGKGRNVWTCLTYLHAEGQQGAAAMHDCDIANYSVDMLTRLCWPVGLDGISFCKGCSARFSDRLHARVERLLFRPLAEALLFRWHGRQRPVPPHWIGLVISWRYALAGECALDLEEGLTHLRLPAGWGLEAALACQFVTRSHRVAQVEIAACYDHRHHELSADDPEKGLHRMAREMVATLLDEVSEGRPEEWISLAAEAGALGIQAFQRSRLSALANGLHFPAEEENAARQLFLDVVQSAARDPQPVPRLPRPVAVSAPVLAALKTAAVRL